MRIRKIEQGTVPSISKVFTEFNESKIDTYSCNTINTMLNTIECNDPLPVGTVLEFDGDEIPEGYGLVDEGDSVSGGSRPVNIMTVENHGKQVFPAQVYTKIELATPTSVGDKLEAYNGGIKIGAGVSKVKISGYAVISTTVSGECNLRIVKNENLDSGTLHWLVDTTPNAAAHIMVTCPPFLAEVAEGDAIFMYSYTVGEGHVGSSNNLPQSHLTVEVVE